MSNTHNLFQKFNGNLQIKQKKKLRLMKSRDALKEKIQRHFKTHHPEYIPIFRGQGSYSTGTMIRTKNNTCDLDFGVYFYSSPSINSTKIQKWILEAVQGSSSESPQHRSKCIRVVYRNDYHIDLPIYYKASKGNHDKPYLAVKNDGWYQSDPKEFQDWFNRKKDDSGQLVRIVRYLKAWCDHKSKKMPNGLTMTVLASRYIQYNVRDDIALRNTLINIRNALKSSWTCTMPTTPGDDLLRDYYDNRFFFFDAINSLIEETHKAIHIELNQKKASKIWQKHLGNYYPEGEDSNVDQHAKTLAGIASTILSGKAKIDKNGRIQSSDGVDHKAHKNFGGDGTF